MRKLLLLFAVLPPLDLFLLFKLGKAYGAGLPIACVLFAFACGAWLARRLGLRVVRDWRESFASGRPPSGGVVQDALALFGCVLLMLPGLITDALGAALLVPPLRRLAAATVNRRLRDAIERGAIHVHGTGAPVSPGAYNPFAPQRTVIDVEAEVVDPPKEPPKQLEG